MLRIGASYIIHSGETSRLCADLTIGNHGTILWFEVKSSQEDSF